MLQEAFHGKIWFVLIPRRHGKGIGKYRSLKKRRGIDGGRVVGMDTTNRRVGTAMMGHEKTLKHGVKLTSIKGP
jgi:hypothetical protein